MVTGITPVHILLHPIIMAGIHILRHQDPSLLAILLHQGRIIIHLLPGLVEVIILRLQGQGTVVAEIPAAEIPAAVAAVVIEDN